MSRSLRKINREREKISSPFDTKLMEAWNRGFSAGAREQNKQDTELMLEWLGKLEEIPGIGEKTAWKTDSWKRMIRWKARGYVIVNQYDPKNIQNCKA